MERNDVLGQAEWEWHIATERKMVLCDVDLPPELLARVEERAAEIGITAQEFISIAI